VLLLMRTDNGQGFVGRDITVANLGLRYRRHPQPAQQALTKRLPKWPQRQVPQRVPPRRMVPLTLRRRSSDRGSAQLPHETRSDRSLPLLTSAEFKQENLHELQSAAFQK